SMTLFTHHPSPADQTAILPHFLLVRIPQRDNFLQPEHNNSVSDLRRHAAYPFSAPGSPLTRSRQTDRVPHLRDCSTALRTARSPEAATDKYAARLSLPLQLFD